MNSMTFNEYQKQARKTAIYPNLNNNLSYPTLGLCGEAGEVAEKVKKIERDQGGIWSNKNKDEIKLELSDVLWYIANIACEIDVALEDIAISNIEKLQSRQKRGKLQGSGDNR